VVKEKDLFEAVDGLLQARPHAELTDALLAYLAEHPNEQYTNLFYLTGEVSEQHLDSLSMIKSFTRQMIYVRDTENSKEEMPVEMLQQSTEMGMELWSVDTHNVKRDMEQLRLG
jgi:hypothetical protein